MSTTKPKRPARRIKPSIAAYRTSSTQTDSRRPLAAFSASFLVDAVAGNIDVPETERAALDAIEAEAQRALDLAALAGLESFRRDLEVIERAQSATHTPDHCLPMATALDDLLAFYWDHHGAAHSAQVAAAKAMLKARDSARSIGRHRQAGTTGKA